MGQPGDALGGGAGGVLLATGTAYPTYFAGAQFIHFLLGPAVVALGWPLWQRRAALRARWGGWCWPLWQGHRSGSQRRGAGLGTGPAGDVLMSLAPKSVTAPVAMGVAAQIGGVPALAAVFAALTGMVGALSARWLFGLMRLPTDAEGMALRGFALGTASHGIGAAHAMQVNADAGAYAGLALGLQVVLAAVLMPLVFRLFMIKVAPALIQQALVAIFLIANTLQPLSHRPRPAQSRGHETARTAPSQSARPPRCR